MQIAPIYGEWLQDELGHQLEKFEHSQQVEQLTATHLTSNTNFAGRMSTYWGRLMNNRRAVLAGEVNPRDTLLKDTQLIGKLTPSMTALWRTMRTAHKPDYDGSNILPIQDIVRTAEVFGSAFVKEGYVQLAKIDIDDTSLGKATHFYGDHLKQHGVPETSLGMAAELARIRPLYLEAAQMAMAQFELCYETLGVLPRGGLSQGNIELWRPEV